MRTSTPDADMPPSLEPPEPGSAEAAARAAAEAALGRLPPRLRRSVARLLSRWPGRIVFRSAASCIRIEIFDRSMTIAAQFFTSVFPILILIATWGATDTSGSRRRSTFPRSRSVLGEAARSSEAATFGIVGALIVFASATSLSRGATRVRGDLAPAAAQEQPAVGVAVAGRGGVARALAHRRARVERVRGGSPTGERVAARGRARPRSRDRGVRAVAVAVGCRTLRSLVLGAGIFALVMLGVRPASAVWLPHARGRARSVRVDRRGVHLPGGCTSWPSASSHGCPRSGDRRRSRWLGRWIEGDAEADPASGVQAR